MCACIPLAAVHLQAFLLLVITWDFHMSGFENPQTLLTGESRVREARTQMNLQEVLISFLS
jgi:hypothetical protein